MKGVMKKRKTNIMNVWLKKIEELYLSMSVKVQIQTLVGIGVVMLFVWYMLVSSVISSKNSAEVKIKPLQQSVVMLEQQYKITQENPASTVNDVLEQKKKDLQNSIKKAEETIQKYGATVITPEKINESLEVLVNQEHNLKLITLKNYPAVLMRGTKKHPIYEYHVEVNKVIKVRK